MKKVITKTIPEVKARSARTVEKVVTLCDFDGKKSADHYGNERKCMRCDRDICWKHMTYDPDEYGDNGGYYCPICWKFYKEKYQLLFYKFQDKQYAEEEQFWEQLKEESLNEQISI